VELNYIYKFDMNILFNRNIKDGVLKCSALLCDRAKEVVTKRDSLLFEQIFKLKDEDSNLEEILCIIDFSGFIKYHKMIDLANIKELELKIHLLDEGKETKKEKTIIVKDFLKSNSMSKDCQVYYINSKVCSISGKNLYEELLPRVFFGFELKPTTLTKLYSYSGTLCSDCNLLNDIKLNEDEIVVVKDKNYIVKSDCITMISLEFLYNELKKIKNYFKEYPTYKLADILEFNACVEFDSLYNSMNNEGNNISNKLKELIKKYHLLPKEDKEEFEDSLAELIDSYSKIGAEDNKVNWERIIVKDYPFDLNLFDGEGLISLEFCEEIRKSLCNKISNNKYKNSTSFQIRLPYVKGMVHSCDFKKFFNNKGVRFVEHTIFDGDKKYDINKVKMILTESQFKLLSFIKDKNCPIKNINDYIKLVNDYGYSFGVIDANKEEKIECSLEYQFISTLPLNNNDILNLFNDSKYKINEKCLKDNIIKSLREDNSSMAKEELAMYNLNNDLYFSTLRFKNRKNKLFARLKNKAMFSKFDVHGTRRYLSSNLLELLYHVAFNDYNEYPTKEYLYENQFYMPTKMHHDNAAVFLRSPHYSRNEIVFLNRRPVVLQLELEEYFSHLTGVVMINPRSLSAERLGGADFDGDTVLVVNDKNIISPVKRDLIVHDERFKIKYKYLPCKIPSLKGKNMIYSDYSNRLTCLQNTFSSEVGKLSNEAICRSVELYNSNSPSDYNIMADYTILNGIEIDSAKTGKKPYINFMDEKDKLVSEFLKYKKEYDENKNVDSVYEFIDSLPIEVYDIGYEYDKNEKTNSGYKVLSILLNMSKIKLYTNEDFNPYKFETKEPGDRVKALAISLIYSNFNSLARKVLSKKAQTINSDRVNRIHDQLDEICQKNNIDLENIIKTIDLDNFDAYELLSKYVNDSKYHFMVNINERKEYIKKLLSLDNNKLIDDLAKFDNDGFRMLFLLLNYFINRLNTIKLNSSTYEKSLIKKKISEFDDNEKKRFNDLYFKYEAYINSLISDNKKATDEELKEMVIDYLKNEASSLSVDDINSVIKIYSSNMIFDVFFDVIKNYVEVSNG